MVQIRIDTSEVDALAIRIGAVPERVIGELAALTRQTAMDIEATAKGLAPIRTGTLMRSIHHTIGAGGLSAEIGTDLYYAGFVEFGTSKMAPQPYMLPAFERHRGQFVDGVGRIAGQSLLGR